MNITKIKIIIWNKTVIHH